MNRTKKLVLASLTVASISGVGLFSQNVFAQSPQDTATLASKIASKFNLDETEVKTVLEEYRLNKHAEREAKFTEELNKAVADGKLTDDQKSKIVAKRQEIRTKIEEISKITNKTEAQKARQQLREATKTWAKDNNIALRWLRASSHAPGPMQKSMIHEKE